MAAVTLENVHESIEQFRADYRAAKNSRFKTRLSGVKSGGSGADFHYRSETDYLHMVEQSREFERNDPVVGQGIRRLVSSVIQEGFQADPTTGDKDLDAELKGRWVDYTTNADNCHSEGEFTFHQMEGLTLHSAIRDGDIWSLLRADGTIQLIEAHRLRTPARTQRNVVHGILLDEHAKRKQIWVAKEEFGPYHSLKVSDVQQFDIRDSAGYRQVLQIYFPSRTSQRRGIGALVPVTDNQAQTGDLIFSNLVKAQLSALIVLIRERLNGDGSQSSGSAIGDLAGGGTQRTASGGVRPIPGIAAGLDVTAEDGQSIKGFNPAVPNPEFFSHAELLLTFLAVNLDLPLAVLLLDPSKGNFSSLRAAMEQARIRYRELQQLLIQKFHRPIYQWKVRQWLAASPELRRMAGNNPRVLQCGWKVSGYPYIQPLQDASADKVQAEAFLSSPRQLQGKRGRDWDDVSTEIIDDRVQLIRKAMVASNALRAEFDVDITWRDILSPSLGGHQQISKSGQIPLEDSETN